MTPDDMADAAQIKKVGDLMIEFMGQFDLRPDLWMATLMAIHRIFMELCLNI